NLGRAQHVRRWRVVIKGKDRDSFAVTISGPCHNRAKPRTTSSNKIPTTATTTPAVPDGVFASCLARSLETAYRKNRQHFSGFLLDRPSLLGTVEQRRCSREERSHSELRCFPPSWVTSRGPW